MMADAMKITGDAHEEVADHVRKLFEKAREHKENIVQSRIVRGYDARFGYYPDDSSCEDGGINGSDKGSRDQIYVNYLGTKMDDFAAILKRVYADAQDRVWTIEPTPEPELPMWLKLDAINKVKILLAEAGVPETARLEQIMLQFKQAAVSIWEEQGRLRTKAMSRLMEDQQEEGGFRLALNEFMHWLPSEPTATMKGPYPAYKMGLRYKGDTLEQGFREVLEYQHLPVWTVFPAPDATTAQNGSFFIHVERHCKADLHAWLESDHDSFIEKGIKDAIEEYEDAELKDKTYTGINFRILDKQDYTSFERTETLDIVKCYTKISGKHLGELSVRRSEERKFNPKKQYEVELWIVGGHLIFADADPYPLGVRPFNSYSFRRRNDSFWGDSIYDVAISQQRVINAAERSLVRNMAYASGPFGTVEADRFIDGVPDQIDPFVLHAVTQGFSGQSGHGAIQIQQLDSNASELLNVMQFHQSLMDSALQIPSTIHGGVPGGGVFRSGVGAAIHQNAANTPLEAILDDLDKHFFEPMLRQHFNWNLLFHEKDNVKYDSQVKARGAQGLRKLHASAQESVNQMQYLIQLAQMGIIPPEGLQAFAGKTLESQGIDPSIILGGTQIQALLQSVQGPAGPGAAQQGVAPAIGAPDAFAGLDGRSQPQVPTEVQI